MSRYFNSCIFILFVYNLVGCIHSLEREITMEVDAGREECFYQAVNKGEYIEVDYQVLSGGQGNLDISFTLTAPSGLLVLSDRKEADNTHRVQATETGDFRFCWDNTFSHFSQKTVFFELTIEQEEDNDSAWNLDVAYNPPGVSPSKVYEMKIQDIQDSMNRVRAHLTKIRHFQDAIRAFEARDRNVAESNFTRVNSWSMIQIAVMLVVGMVQVVLVRSLFDDKSSVHRMWKQTFSS